MTDTNTVVEEVTTSKEMERHQTVFSNKVYDIVTDHIDSFGSDEESDLDLETVRDAIRGTATEIIGIIEGEDTKKNPGYYLIPKNLSPFQHKEVVESYNIAVGLSTMFENINS